MTPQASHTPGPWHIIGIGEVGVVQIKSLANGNGAMLCRHDGSAEGEANARLIAAAPELLAALNAIIRSYETEGCDSCGTVSEDVIQSALAAISKATQPSS